MQNLNYSNKNYKFVHLKICSLKARIITKMFPTFFALARPTKLKLVTKWGLYSTTNVLLDNFVEAVMMTTKRKKGSSQ